MKKFKLGILIPLKSLEVSSDWTSVQLCLLRSLRSINNQTSGDFQCVVVGHEEPELFNISEVSKNTSFVTFDEFPPPDTKVYTGADLQLKYEFDRCSKIAKGMMVLKASEITHWFVLDADDLMRADFVSTITSFKKDTAIVLDNGYFYFDSYNIVNETDEFSKYCGSSCVVSCEINTIPETLDEYAFQKTFFGSVSHVFVKEYLSDKDIFFTVPSERMMMYVRGTGENISQFYTRSWFSKLKQYLGMRLKRVSFSNSQFDEFGFDLQNNTPRPAKKLSRI